MNYPTFWACLTDSSSAFGPHRQTHLLDLPNLDRHCFRHLVDHFNSDLMSELDFEFGFGQG